MEVGVHSCCCPLWRQSMLGARPAAPAYLGAGPEWMGWHELERDRLAETPHLLWCVASWGLWAGTLWHLPGVGPAVGASSLVYSASVTVTRKKPGLSVHKPTRSNTRHLSKVGILSKKRNGITNDS